jgi:hypothetical protein
VLSFPRKRESRGSSVVYLDARVRGHDKWAASAASVSLDEEARAAGETRSGYIAKLAMGR